MSLGASTQPFSLAYHLSVHGCGMMWQSVDLQLFNIFCHFYVLYSRSSYVTKCIWHATWKSTFSTFACFFVFCFSVHVRQWVNKTEQGHRQSSVSAGNFHKHQSHLLCHSEFLITVGLGHFGRKYCRNQPTFQEIIQPTNWSSTVPYFLFVSSKKLGSQVKEKLVLRPLSCTAFLKL